MVTTQGSRAQLNHEVLPFWARLESPTSALAFMGRCPQRQLGGDCHTTTSPWGAEGSASCRALERNQTGKGAGWQKESSQRGWEAAAWAPSLRGAWWPQRGGFGDFLRVCTLVWFFLRGWQSEPMLCLFQLRVTRKFGSFQRTGSFQVIILN